MLGLTLLVFSVKWVTFPSTVHWQAAGADLAVGGVSHGEMLILYELWAGERLVPEKALTRYRRPGRPISVAAVSFGPGIDIRRACRFTGALIRSLCILPGGIGRFVPCRIGANHCRLRRIGWEKCGHELTYRQKETAGVTLFDELQDLFRYPPRSALALLEGTLPLRYCAVTFASRIPTWRLPPAGGVARLVTDDGEELGMVRVEPCVRAGTSCLHDGIGVDWVRGPGGGGTRVRLSRKSPAHPCAEEFFRVPISHSCVEEIESSGSQEWEHVDAKRRYVCQHADGAQPAHPSLGVRCCDTWSDTVHGSLGCAQLCGHTHGLFHSCTLARAHFELDFFWFFEHTTKATHSNTPQVHNEGLEWQQHAVALLAQGHFVLNSTFCLSLVVRWCGYL